MTTTILNIGALTIEPPLVRERPAYTMGILNVTPDSFSDGGLYESVGAAVDRVGVMIEQGADCIDIGGASSRPRGSAYGKGAAVLSAEEEAERVVPSLVAIRSTFPTVPISVDTYHALVAREAIAAGADAINDITALQFDPDMIDVVAKSSVPVILMHSVGSPGAMPHEHLEQDVEHVVADSLSASISQAQAAGISDIIVDPGFGFGKTERGNFRLLRNLDYLRKLNRPILVGLSRKTMIGQGIGKQSEHPKHRVVGSVAAAVLAVTNGASIVRTHDVAETSEALQIVYATQLEQHEQE